MQLVHLLPLAVTVTTLVVNVFGQDLDPFAAEFDITAVEFKRRIDEGFFAAIIDVRTMSEFEAGHIENATLIESLASFGTSSQITTPSDLAGCESCDLGIYCQSGNRAGQAIKLLKEAGFQGRLYNGQGVSQWTDEGYPLVTGPSTPALCATAGEGKEMCELSYLARTNTVAETPTNGAEGGPEETEGGSEEKKDVSGSSMKYHVLSFSGCVATLLSYL